MRLRAILAGPLALLTIGTATAQRTTAPATAAPPVDEAPAAVSPDDAAQGLIQLCIINAVAGVNPVYARRVDMTGEVQRVFPGRALKKIPGVSGDYLDIDVKAAGRLTVRFSPEGFCGISPDVRLGPPFRLEAPVREAFRRQMGRFPDFVDYSKRGTDWTWRRPDRYLFAHVGDMMVRISPGLAVPAK